MHKKFLRTVLYIVSVLLLLAGALIYVYPIISEKICTDRNEEYIQAFYEQREQATENCEEADSEGEGSAAEYDELYEKMVEYNTEIYENGQSGLTDAWSYEVTSIDLTEYGVYNGVVGVLRIPEMDDLEMPIFLGASYENMSLGAAQLGQTSMPVGGENTNCVIAGHRGWSGAKYFLEIENLEIGDYVYIDNLWETLTYRVCEIKVISPDEVDEVYIQEGRDMVTLITCHPYPHNYQRYVVYCERYESADSDIYSYDEASYESQSTVSSSKLYIKLEEYARIAILIFVIMFAFLMFLHPKKHKRK